MLICVFFLVFLQFIFPTLLENTVRTRLSERLFTHDIVLDLSSTPNIALAFGKIDKFRAVSHNAKVGNVYFEELSAEGGGLEVDMISLLFHNQLLFSHAKEAKFKGIITELNLKDLMRRDEKLKNVEVSITPKEILATSTFKAFGQEAHAELAGNVIVEDGALVFKLLRLNVKNSIIGTIKLDSIFSDYVLVKPNKLPFGAEFTDTVLDQGKVFIEAEKNEQ